MSSSSLNIAVAQINCVVGDLSGNAQRILAAAATAHEAGADLLVTPELSLSGYPAEDLLLRPDYYAAADRELRALARALPAIAVVVGHPLAVADTRYNAASVLMGGEVRHTYRKMRLPNYEVFDEERYFDAGEDACVFVLNDVRVGLNICADVWESGAAEAARAAGAEILVAINASPYHMSKLQRRHEVLRERVADTRIPVVYCNLVGGQDELVFDGGSFALSAGGALRFQAPSFEERIDVVEMRDGDILPAVIASPTSLEQDVWSALVMGVRDYLGKNGFPGALIGLSGGIDSALTLCVAVEALGPERVRAVMMPSPYTAQMSLDDSRLLVQRLGVRYDEIPIQPAMQAFETLLAPHFQGLPADATEENLQARIRGMLLMALSNKTGAIVLTTGNKSEMAVGYATLYGDMAGGFAVIKDLFKTLVYRLSRWCNRNGELIPDNIITRPPSAELKPDQTDQDTLPPYEVLDAIIEAYMERDESPREIIEQGYAEADVRRVVGMLKRNEYKRRQAPIGVRVTRRGFGKDWRYPITARYQDEY
ncbi:NAD+ synthase [Niveibacterium sp. SC-1]|uniref:NAD+ synthase n=1 Tax=Niveibacterium sp. SC-1 TaxID=3135646 RepID=UPI00311D8E8F